MRTASWVIRDRATKAVICETFNPKSVAALNAAKYEAVPILEYLQSLNEDIAFADAVIKKAREDRN